MGRGRGACTHLVQIPATRKREGKSVVRAFRRGEVPRCLGSAQARPVPAVLLSWPARPGLLLRLRFAYLRAVTHTAAGCVWLVAGLKRKGRRVAARRQPGAERLLQFAIPRSHLSPSWGTLPSCSLSRQRGLVAAACDTGSVGRSGRASAAGEWPRAGPPGQLQRHRGGHMASVWSRGEQPCSSCLEGEVCGPACEHQPWVRVRVRVRG